MRLPNAEEIKLLAEAQRAVQRAQHAAALAQLAAQQAQLACDEQLVSVQEACHVPPGAGIDLSRKCWIAAPAPAGSTPLELGPQEEDHAQR